MNRPIDEDAEKIKTNQTEQANETIPISEIKNQEHNEDTLLFKGETQIDKTLSISQHHITRKTTIQSEPNKSPEPPPKIQDQNKQGKKLSLSFLSS